MLINELDNIINLYYSDCSSYNNILSISKEILTIFKRRSLNKFKQSDIEKYIKNLKTKGNTNATINTKLSFISKALKYYKNELIIPFQKVSNKEKETISNTQYNYLIEETKDNEELNKFIQIAYYTGLRANEILNIRIQHIKYDNGYFINLYNTKNHRDNFIPITNKLNSIFDNFQEFSLNYKQVYYLLKKFNITPHQFRHTFITNCYEKGLDSFTIMKLTNQTSLSVHQRYNHISNKRLQDVVNVL